MSRVENAVDLYGILVSLYQHEDRLLEDRNKFFGTLILGLLVATTGFLTSPYFVSKSPVYLFCGVGAILSLLWWGLVSNSLYYIKLRMQQGIEMERELGLSLFEAERKLCYDRMTTKVGGEEIRPPRRYWLHGADTPRVLSCVYLVLYVSLFLYSMLLYG